MSPPWFKESGGKLLSAKLRILPRDDTHPSQHQDQGPISMKGNGLPLDFTPEARKSKCTLRRSGNHGSNSEGDAVAAARRDSSSINSDSTTEELNTFNPPSRTDKPTGALPRLNATKKLFLENENIQKKIREPYSPWIYYTNENSVATTNLSRMPLQMVNIEPGGKPSEQSKSLEGFENQGSKRVEKANKAIDHDFDYLDQSVPWHSTDNGKIDNNSYRAPYAIHYRTWSLPSWPGRTYDLTEPHEEDKIICDEAAISCEAEPLSDLYGQIQKGHLTVEEGILQAFIGVEDERSHNVRFYSHVGGFKLCSRFDPIDEISFIQASSNALLPDEASSTPLLEVPPSRKKYVFVWQCCACGTSRINIMINECPGCGEPRCAYCKTEKVQVR